MQSWPLLTGFCTQRIQRDISDSDYGLNPQVLLITSILLPWEDLLLGPLKIGGHTSIHDAHNVDNVAALLLEFLDEKVLISLTDTPWCLDYYWL